MSKPKSKKPTLEESLAVEALMFAVDGDGLEYAMSNYGTDVKDPDYQALRDDYLAAAAKLKTYIHQLAVTHGFTPEFPLT